MIIVLTRNTCISSHTCYPGKDRGNDPCSFPFPKHPLPNLPVFYPLSSLPVSPQPYPLSSLTHPSATSPTPCPTSLPDLPPLLYLALPLHLSPFTCSTSPALPSLPYPLFLSPTAPAGLWLYLVSPVFFLNANPNRAIFLAVTVLNMASITLLAKRRRWKSLISIT